MGAVYKARDVNLGRVVALKILPQDKMANPDRRRRFLQEAKAASALNHPNIVTIYEIASDQSIDYIAMELVDGRTLEAILASGALRIPEVLTYARQMADALTAAHAAGILHRDLKPANVMVRDSGAVKLLDFGLAKRTVGGEADEPDATLTMGLTQAGAIMGTVAYMSPEQAQGMKLDFRSDIFSFGGILYEMVANKRAFDGESPAALLASLLRDQPQPLTERRPDTPPALEALILSCLQKDPSQRAQTMAVVKAALGNLAELPLTITTRTPALEAASALLHPPPILGAQLSGPQSAQRPGPLTPQPPPAVLASSPLSSSQVASSQAPPAPPRLEKRRRRLGKYWWLIPLAFWLIPKLLRESPPVSDPKPKGSRIVNVPAAPIQLTTEGGLAREPSFSPDGKRVVYSWNGVEPGNFNIYVRSLDQQGSRRLTTEKTDDFEPAWSPDGHTIAFLRRRGADDEIVLVPADGGADRKIGEIAHRAGNVLAWTRNSGALVFPDAASAGGSAAIYEQTLATGAKRRLVKPLPSDANDLWPSVPPNGSDIAFVRQFTDGHSEIFTAEMPDSDEADATPEQITFLGAMCSHPVWVSDQREIIFSFANVRTTGSSPSWDLWRVASDGSNKAQPVALSSPGGDHPAVSALGGTLAYDKLAGDHGALWLIDPFR